MGTSSLLLERGSSVGGWCRSIQDRGFSFDYAGHIMFSKDPYVLALYEKLLGKNVRWQDREAWIWSKGVYTRYPFQGALYGLPPRVLKECLFGAIEARFGPLNGNVPADRAADAPANFEEFIHRVWGSGVARHFAIPYNRKLWAVPLHEMETSWLGGRVPLPNLEETIEGALSPVPRPMGPNARFGYPLRGFQALMDGFVPLLRGELRLHAEVCATSPRKRTGKLRDSRMPALAGGDGQGLAFTARRIVRAVPAKSGTDRGEMVRRRSDEHFACLESSLIMLDEPTSSLDPVTEADAFTCAAFHATFKQAQLPVAPPAADPRPARKIVPAAGISPVRAIPPKGGR